MKFLKLKTAVVAGLLAVGLAASSSAATAPAGAKPDPAEMARAQLAGQMAFYGVENHDPYSLLAAVEAMHGLHAKVAVPDRSNTGNKNTYDPVALLKEAKTFATADANLSRVIDAKLAQIGTGQGYYLNGYYYCTYGYYWYAGYLIYGCY